MTVAMTVNHGFIVRIQQVGGALPPAKDAYCICLQAFKAVLDSLHAFPHVHLIVATRLEAPPVAGVAGGPAAVELSRLDAAAGMQLLGSHLGAGHHWAEADQEAARKLVDEVQGNPLVLSVAVGLMMQGRDFTWQVSGWHCSHP
jgi:hypothetical protein